MKDFLKVLQRFLPPYYRDVVLSFIFNFLSAFFSVFSVAIMIPILEIIFQQEPQVYEFAPWSMSFEVIKQNFYFYLTLLKDNYGPGYAMLFSGLFLIIGTMLKTGFAYLASYTSVGIRNNVVRDIRQQIYAKIMKLPIGFFSNEKKGDIIARATGDVGEVEGSVMASLDMFLKNPILILVYLATMLIMSFKLTLFVFVVLPFAGAIIGRIGKSLKRTSLEGQNKMGVVMSILDESLSGLRIVKAFNAEKKMADRFNNETEEYCDIAKRLTRRRDLAHPMSEFLGTIVVVFVVWFGGTLILNNSGGLSVAAFLAYLGVFYQIINPAKAFSTAMYSIQKGMAAMDRIDMILLADNEVFEKGGGSQKKTLDHSIEYRNVTFAYNEIKVLKNVSVTIPKGKTVALVGQSGSGKSTFVDLLPRFYDVEDGGIFIDGVNIKDFNLYDLRELMGNVNQEAILFNDTIFNNISFGVESATFEEVVAAAKIANAHEFIVSSENGYDTIIGDRGSKLSGGQRQRLSIARAVLKNPPIMILDEATSALDTESEKLVQDALDKLMQNRTSLVVAHRLSTIRNADMICVFHEGEIVETGSHDELIEKNGIYKKLYSLQSF